MTATVNAYSGHNAARMAGQEPVRTKPETPINFRSLLQTISMSDDGGTSTATAAAKTTGGSPSSGGSSGSGAPASSGTEPWLMSAEDIALLGDNWTAANAAPPATGGVEPKVTEPATAGVEPKGTGAEPAMTGGIEPVMTASISGNSSGSSGTEPVTPPPGSALEKPVTDSDAGNAAELAIAAMRAALMRFAEFNPAMKLDAKI